MAKESTGDVKTGPGLNYTERAEFLDLSRVFKLVHRGSRNHESRSASHQPHVR